METGLPCLMITEAWMDLATRDLVWFFVFVFLFLLSAEERELTDVGCFLFEKMLSRDNEERVISRSGSRWGLV